MPVSCSVFLSLSKYLMFMKQIIFAVLFLFCTITCISAQGIEFFHGTWPEALAKAKAEKKMIFVDAFAAWCSPCKRMAKETFPDSKVGDYFNNNFINLKIDMEHADNTEFASKYTVQSYPTLFFIDENGKIVTREIGAKDVEQLLEVGKKAMGKNDRSVEFEKLYSEGNRDPQMLLDYVKALNGAGKPSLKITNDYLKTQKDLSTEFNLRFILEGAIAADSRVFDLMCKNKNALIALVGAEAYKARVETACKCTVKKAVEFKDQTLLDEVKKKMKEGNPDRAKMFGYEAEMSYFKATKDTKNYLKALEGYKDELAPPSAKLHDLVINLLRTFPNDSKALLLAEKWAKSVVQDLGNAEYHMTLADVYKRQGDNDKAQETAKKALEVAGEKDPLLKEKINQFINSLKS